MRSFVPWEKTNPEFSPAVRVTASKQIIKINGKMRAVEPANPNMQKPR